MKHKIEIEDIFSSSVKVLYNRLSTTGGLAEWFADDVDQKGDIFTFTWKDSEQDAELIEMIPNTSIKFRWLDAEEEEEYFEFVIKQDSLTGDIALLITDFVDEDEQDDAVYLWDKHLDKLHRILGA